MNVHAIPIILALEQPGHKPYLGQDSYTSQDLSHSAILTTRQVLCWHIEQHNLVQLIPKSGLTFRDTDPQLQGRAKHSTSLSRVAHMSDFFGDLAPWAEPAWYNTLSSPHYNDTHKRLRKAVRDYVEENVLPYDEEWEDQGQVPKEVSPIQAFLCTVLGEKSAPLSCSRLVTSGLSRVTTARFSGGILIAPLPDSTCHGEACKSGTRAL